MRPRDPVPLTVRAAEYRASPEMDLIQETPTKRRKTEDGHVSRGRAYDSEDDSGDDLFQGHETVATVPVFNRPFARSHGSLPLSSPPIHVTQPTQIIEKNTPGSSRKPSVIQVAASSPIRPPGTVSPNGAPQRGTGGLASMMAPAGTMFRPPMGVVKPPVIDLSDDDGPVYRGGPSDDESQQVRRNDIKPSTFVQSTKDSRSNGGNSRFREITAGAFYRPLEGVQSKGQTPDFKGSVYDSRNRDDSQTTSQITGKRSADVMANAYGSARRPIKQRQAGPAKAEPVHDMSLDSIEDFQLRVKVERMQVVLPSYTVKQCRDALLKKKCNYDDAVDMLLSEEPQAPEIDLTLSDDEKKFTAPPTRRPDKPAKPPIRSIQERWTSTQLPKPSQASVSTEPPKQRRRLVQGRKRPNSPVPEPASPVPEPALTMAPKPSPPRARRGSLDSDDSDSAVDLEVDDDRAEVETKVLKFFNTCSVADLEDIAATTTEVATTLLSQKPFRSLKDIRKVSGDVPTGTATGKTTTRKTVMKKTIKKPIGDKIVDKCIEVWAGYESVDELVQRCETLGRPVADEMNKWDFNIYGGSKNGELDQVNPEHTLLNNDSGIGTPTSGHATDDDSITPQKKLHSLSQPGIMGKDVVLKDYQIVGVNWLSLLFDKGLSCILADDMGLGKTCQVIAFLAHLKEKGVNGPHIVVVPPSTLENWLREFSIFCPDLEVIPFYSDLKGREAVREQIRQNIDSIDVVVTTYSMAKLKEETKFLRRLSPVVCVFDEGHALKNSDSVASKQLMKITAQFRLLLTGTPLQNNLRELVSLLGFILPNVFNEHSENLSYIFSHKAKTTDDSHAALLSVQRIARAKAMMTPFVLRRKKHQVLKNLPGKIHRVEYCELSASQIEIYDAETQKAQKIVQNRAAGIKSAKNESANIIMALRKASIHPLLHRRLYTDTIIAKISTACVDEPELPDRNPDFCFEDLSVMTDHEIHNFCATYPTTMSTFLLPSSPNPIFDSGKITALTALLKTYLANGDRVLVFSQFVIVLEIVGDVLESLGIEYSYLIGATPIPTRQPLIDAFNAPDSPTSVFLLSTKAGGTGINLASANKVIIFDSSFNPQDDIQAENRAHRVGQTREVEVVRLVSRGTVEEQILALGESKVLLDDRVAGVGDESKGMSKAEEEGLKKVEEMVFGELEEEANGNGEGA